MNSATRPGGEPPESEDNPCCEDPGDSSWWCGCYAELDNRYQWVTSGEPQLCVSEAEAATYCANHCQGIQSAIDWHLTPILCVYPWQPPSTPTCGSWDPGTEVSYSGGVHYLDYAFVATLANDPEPVMYCDDALVLKLDGTPGFKIANADSGELLYELGLRDDDIIVSINAMPLDDYEDVVHAVNALWYGGQTSYTLEIERNSTTTYLYFQVVYTL